MAREGLVCLESVAGDAGGGAVPRLVTAADDRISVLVGPPRVGSVAGLGGPPERTEPLVLVVASDQGTCATLRSGLAECGFQAASAADVGAAIRILPQLRPDAVLLDSADGRFEAQAVCAAMRWQLRESTTPIVVLGPPPQLEGADAAPDAGGADFVASPSGPRALARLLHSSLRRGQAARHPADFDATTALPNQRFFRRRLARALERAEREGRLVAVLSVDLELAESLDPSTMAQLLGQVAERLSTCVRASDVVAIGRAEPATGTGGRQRFDVLLDDLDDLEVASTVASRISVELQSPFQVDGREVLVAASIGIANHPRDGAVAKVPRTDSEAQRETRAASRPDALVDLDRLALASRLREAVEREVLVLHYQPQFEASSGAVIGLEALVRWHDGERLVPPDEFLPIAEETGVVVPLGEWVLRTACAQAVAWQRAGLRPVRLSVNVSGRQLQPGFATFVRQVLDDAQLAPEWLQLELSDTALADAAGTEAALTALRAVGVRVAIKASSFTRSHLRLPIAAVKIGRGLVKGVGIRPDGAAIVRAIVEMALSLRLGVMAEGVERPEQLELLQREGCTAMQGFLLAGPSAADDVTTLLATEVRDDGGEDVAQVA